ncbi:Lon protease 2 [compost metagenome]
MGTLLEIEATAVPVEPGRGTYNITGVVDEEEIGGGSRTLRRKSMAKGSVENVLTVLKRIGLDPSGYDLHINFPGGTPIDGPSAGLAIATAIASAIKCVPVDHRIAMTGELGIYGKVKPVGGVVAKVEAAFQAGAKTVLIPKDNWQTLFEGLDGLRVIPVESVSEVFQHVFGSEAEKNFGLAPAEELFAAAPPPTPTSFFHAESPSSNNVM